MKTSLQELIEWLDKRIEDCNEIGGLEIAKWAFIQAKKEATELLEKEQVQLESTNQDKVREAAVDFVMENYGLHRDRETVEKHYDYWHSKKH